MIRDTLHPHAAPRGLRQSHRAGETRPRLPAADRRRRRYLRARLQDEQHIGHRRSHGDFSAALSGDLRRRHDLPAGLDFTGEGDRHICHRRIGRDRRRRCRQCLARGHRPIGDCRSIGRRTGGLFSGGVFLRHCRNLCVLFAEDPRGDCRDRHLGCVDPAGRHAGYRACGTKHRSVSGQRDDCPVQRFWNLIWDLS